MMDRYLLEPDVNTLQPVLKEYNNLPCCASFKDDFPQSDHAMCDCASEILTPPLSPEQFPISPAATKTGLPEVKTFYNSFMTNPPNTFVEELLITNFSNDCPRVLPDLKDTCTELFSREPMHLSVPHRKIFNQSSSKDCMWNGRGFRPIVRNRSQSRSDSPGSPICSPVSGCVDPRSVFNQFGDRRKSLSPHRARIASGAETPSDSEEEVDVVTVEAPRVLKQSGVGFVSDGGKVLGRLVQNNNGSPLTLVTSGRKKTETCNRNQQTRGRPARKTKNHSGPVSMVIRSGNGNPKTVNVQLKCVPIVKSSGKSVSVGRKLTGSTDNSAGGERVVHLMRLAPNASPVTKVDQNNDSKKRRILSLEGISMVSSTGVKQVTKVPVSNGVVVTKNEPIDSKVGFPTQADSGFPINGDKKKTVKKNMKRSITSSYETPTSSPESANGEFPCSPKRRGGFRVGAIGEEMTRAAHNVLERQRREGLRNLYHDLRMVVPEVADVEKAPKVCILTKAREHVVGLQKQAAQLHARKLEEQERQNMLKRRVRALTSELTSVGPTSYTKSNFIKREFPDSLQKFALYVS